MVAVLFNKYAFVCPLFSVKIPPSGFEIGFTIPVPEF